jgi:hypothetical protein
VWCRSVLLASTRHGMYEFGAVLQWRLLETPGPDMGRVRVGPVVGSEGPALELSDETVEVDTVRGYRSLRIGHNVRIIRGGA